MGTADANRDQAGLLLGMSFYGAKQFSEAAKYLSEAAKSDPENLELHQMLAQSCLSARQFSCASDEFQWILKKNPDSAAAHMLLGEALDGLGRTPEAIAEFQAASKAAPQTPEVFFGLGYLNWKMRQYGDAAQALETVLATDPANPQALAYMGDIELKRDHFDKSLGLLIRATQQRKDIRIVYVDLGVIHTQRKEYKEALAALRRAEKLDPSQPDVHYRLGRLYQAIGKSEVAQQEFAKVRQLHEKDDDDLAHKMSGSPPPPKQ
jgi:tetratricopeptide (TPR) repeat protein